VTTPLVQVEHLSRHFAGKRGLLTWRAPPIRAVEDVSFSIAPGEVVGLVGESGSGKSTIGRALLRLVEPTRGTVRFRGEDIGKISASAMRKLRRHMQVVFQDPYASLDPRKRVEDIIGDILDIHGLAPGAGRRDRVVELLLEVGLGREHLSRFPHQFSGGQRQRISVARALASDPDFVVADEPVSALDVSVQAQIVNLLADLRRRRGLAMLFVSHDLSVVEYLSDRVIVLYLGRIVELAPARELYARPRHPYTRALLSATPVPDPDGKRARIVLSGELPSPANPPSGCVFHTRCAHAVAACRGETPRLSDVSPGHAVACWRMGEI
jgi:oligopeptide/dipeptide ABC transporter ATP-binding protein